MITIYIRWIRSQKSEVRSRAVFTVIMVRRHVERKNLLLIFVVRRVARVTSHRVAPILRDKTASICIK